MHQRITTYIFTLLFTAALLVPRVANLHALDHITDEDTSSISCELCDILVHSYELDVINENYSFLENELYNTPSTFIVFTQYHIPKENIVSPTSIYNKPPPLL